MKPFTRYLVVAEFPDDEPGIESEKAARAVANALSKAGVVRFQVSAMPRGDLMKHFWPQLAADPDDSEGRPFN